MVPSKPLGDGVEIPQLGFGVFQVPADETQRTVEAALEVGYRHIDTAAAYGNEEAVGAALRASGLPREEIFVTTKLWNSNHGRELAERAIGESLDKLGLEFVDLYLIHWPRPARGLQVETWSALQSMKAEGLSRAIGVSNFRVEDLESLQTAGGAQPSINQIELHPYLQQAKLRAWHAEHRIVTEAWSPLGQGAVLDDETIVSIAYRHGRSPAQVVLRWHLLLGNVVIPKSVTPSRMRENFSVFDFDLTADDLEQIQALDREHRTGPDPGEFDRT